MFPDFGHIGWYCTVKTHSKLVFLRAEIKIEFRHVAPFLVWTPEGYPKIITQQPFVFRKPGIPVYFGDGFIDNWCRINQGIDAFDTNLQSTSQIPHWL